MSVGSRLRRILARLGDALLLSVPLLLYGLMLTHPPAGFGFDLHVFWEAARAVGHGNSPYDAAGVAHMRIVEHRDLSVQPVAPWAVYPPALFAALVPLGLLPWPVAAAIGISALAVAPALALRVMGVRDWRCYAVAYASVPIFSSISLGAISTVLMLGFALVWCGRGTVAVGAATMVAKLFLWPLAIVIAAVEGFRRTAILAGVALVATIASWAFIGFADIASYPRILSDLSAIEAHNSFSTTGLAFALGVPLELGTLAGVAAGLAVAGVAYRAGRRGERNAAFALALVAALLLSPIVWMHYLTLLFLPLAARYPRFNWYWLVPLLLWTHPLQAAERSLWAFVVFWSCVAIVVGATMRSGAVTRRDVVRPWAALRPAVAAAPIPAFAP